MLDRNKTAEERALELEAAVKVLSEEKAELERRLAHHAFRSALVNKADLPKCASIACYNCKHVAYVYHPANGALYLLGCAKGGDVCGGFEHSPKDTGATEAIKETLLQLLRDQFPTLQGAVSDDCVYLPTPLCHEAESQKMDL